MNITLAGIYALSFFIGLIILLPVSFEDEYSKRIRIKYGTIFLCVSIIGILWVLLAHHEANKIVKTTIHPIETHLNIPFFVSPTGNFIELTGNDRFVDKHRYDIQYTIRGGLWTCGMYVMEYHDWIIIPKTQHLEF